MMVKNNKIYLFIVLFIFLTRILGAQEWGDVNYDGSINIVDALLVAQYYVGLNPQDFNQQAADVSGDGSINIVDALLIAQFYVGLINEFPVSSTTTPEPTPTEGEYYLLDRAGFSLVYVDSEETSGEDAPATNFFDGNTATFWHTEWESSNPAHPHEIQIDIGGTYDVGGIRYLPRQDESNNGTISGYEVYVGTNTGNWAGNAWTSGAEFNVLVWSGGPTPTPGPTEEPTATPVPTDQPTATPDQGSLSYIVTAVNDGLDNQDLYLMNDGLSGLGYRQMALNTNVSYSQMISYLQSNYTTLYHTGHGSERDFGTANGAISSSTTTINIQNTIIATCLTMSDTGWKNAFGQNAQCIMGYTKESFDYTDNDVVNNMINRLRENKSYAVAWYQANSAIGLTSDRWACYVREGGSINEYSARTGNIPGSKSAPSDLVSLDAAGKLLVSMDILENIDSFPVSPRPDLSFVETDLVIEGEIGALGDVLGECSLTAEDAQACVEQYVSDSGGLPPDAVLDRVIAIVSHGESGSLPTIMGYVVRYIREIDDIMIRSNGIENHIAYLVGQTGSVVTRSSFWPDFYRKEEIKSKGTLLHVNEVMYLAAPSISGFIKEDRTLIITDVMPVYGTYGPNSDIKDIVPAFSFIATDGTFIVVDAATGELIR
jgi:hypothetical protein